jgi:dynein assembly factor 2
MDAGDKLHKKVPTHLTITINVPHMDSVKQAKLDINDSNLVFEVPDLYYLDANLYYKVDPASGSAKFDKSKKSMVIKVPVTGLTDDSEKKIDQDYANYQEQVKKRQEDL